MNKKELDREMVKIVKKSRQNGCKLKLGVLPNGNKIILMEGEK